MRNRRQRKKSPQNITWILLSKRKTEIYLIVHPTNFSQMDTYESVTDLRNKDKNNFNCPVKCRTNSKRCSDDCNDIERLSKTLRRIFPLRNS